MFGSALEINTNEFSEYVRIHCMHTFDVATIDGLSFDIYTRIINSFQESQHSANVDQAYLWYRLNSRCSLKETRNTKLPTEMRSVHVFDFFAVKSSQATRWCLRSAGSALFDSFLCRQVESTRCCSRSAVFFISLPSIGSFWFLRHRRESSRQDGVWVFEICSQRSFYFLPSSRVKRQDAVRDRRQQSIFWFLCRQVELWWC